MRIPAVGLVAILFIFFVAPAKSQDSSPNRLKIKQMREALISDSDLPHLSSQVEEIRKATLVEILGVLNSTLSASNIDTEIRAMFKDYWAKPASILRKNLVGTNVVVVAYLIFHGGAAIPDGTPIIEAFREVGHSYEEAAHGGEGLEDSTAKLEELSSPWPTELWMFAHGQQTRTMQYHERMAIFSFDGLGLKELWTAKAPLKAPTFKVTKEALLITYEDEERVGPALVKTIALTQSGALEAGTVPKIP